MLTDSTNVSYEIVASYAHTVLIASINNPEIRYFTSSTKQSKNISLMKLSFAAFLKNQLLNS